MFIIVCLFVATGTLVSSVRLHSSAHFTDVSFVGPCSDAANAFTSVAPTVCDGEDWWLPSSVERSPAGVLTTYGNPLDEEYRDQAERNPPHVDTYQSYSRRLSGTSLNTRLGKTIDPGTNLTDASITNTLYLMTEYDCYDFFRDECTADGRGYSTCEALYRTLPSSNVFVQSGVTVRHERSKGPVGCTRPYTWRKSRRAITWVTWGGDTGTDWGEYINNSGLASFTGRVVSWCLANGILVTSLPDALRDQLAGNWRYTLDFSNKASYAKMADVFNHFYKHVQYYDYNSHTDSFHLNGESGLWPMYTDQGLFCRRGSCNKFGSHLATWEDIADWHFDMATRAGIPYANLMVNICMGGSEFEPIVHLAKTHVTGLATHGPFFSNTYRFLQHLPHVYYDEDRKAFRTRGKHPFAFLHEDLEVLDHTNNTWGQYRAFRLAALSAMSKGMDRLLVSAYNIPSVGVPQDPAVQRCHQAPSEEQRCLNYNHSVAAAAGAEEMLRWMYQSVGRRDRDAVEAWCAPVEIGSEGSNGETFAQRLAAVMAEHDDLRYTTDRSVYTPLQTFFGVHCQLSVHEEERGKPAVELNTEYTRGRVNISGGGSDLTHPLLTGRASSEGAYPFEARTTEGSECLAMNIDAVVFNNFRRRWSLRTVVKITFMPKSTLSPNHGMSIIGVELKDSWTSQSEQKYIRLGGSPHRLEPGHYHTLTVHFKRFRANPINPVLKITHVDGPHLSYAMVRVIPHFSPIGKGLYIGVGVTATITALLLCPWPSAVPNGITSPL